MCGIAGIFHLSTHKPVDPARVERMCDAIAHRGPDGQGVWTAPSGTRVAWFKDPDGNLLSLAQMA